MNPIPPSFNLYEELPEPVFQDMKNKKWSGWLAIERKERFLMNLVNSLRMAESEEERDQIQKTIDEVIKPTKLTDIDTF